MTHRRWLAAIIAQSVKPMPALPFQRDRKAERAPRMTDQPRSGAFPPASRPWTVRSPAPRAETRAPFDTLYSFTWADQDDAIDERVRMRPSLALFTDSFAALCRGALVQTPDGPVAVEDLVPGDPITACQGVLPLRWKGSRVVAPQHGKMALYRVTAEALGPAGRAPTCCWDRPRASSRAGRGCAR